MNKIVSSTYSDFKEHVCFGLKVPLVIHYS